MTDPVFSGPDAFTLAVLMQRRPPPSARPWLGDSWRVTGVVVNPPQTRVGRIRLLTDTDGEVYLWGGFPLKLHKDEAESYYYNLLAERPSVYVITYPNDQGIPEPFLVSASFDEANAYLEAEGDVAAVVMPPELYRWIERYVLTHYVPERKVKRQRRNWTEQSHD